MHCKLSALGGLAVLCSCAAAPAPAPRPAAAPSPRAAPPAGAGFALAPLPSPTLGDLREPCVVAEPIRLGAPGELRHVETGERVGHRRTLALGFGPEGGLVLWERDEMVYAVRRLDAEGRPDGEEREVRLDGTPLHVRPTAGGGAFVTVFCPAVLECRSRHGVALLEAAGGLVASAEIAQDPHLLDGVGRGPDGGARLYYGGMPGSDDPLAVVDVTLEAGELRQRHRSMPRIRRDWGPGRPVVVELHPEGEELALWLTSESPPELVGASSRRSLEGSALETARWNVLWPLPVGPVAPGRVALVDASGVRFVDLGSGAASPAPERAAPIGWVAELVRGVPWLIPLTGAGVRVGEGFAMPGAGADRWRWNGEVLLLAAIDPDGVRVTPVRCSEAR